MQNKRIVWSKDVTNIIKGIAILMIVLGHAGNRIPGARVLTPLGAVGVGLFLICSGYGLEKSYIKNGLSKYWTKKLYGIYMPWVLIEVIGFFFHPQVGGGNLSACLPSLAQQLSFGTDFMLKTHCLF